MTTARGKNKFRKNVLISTRVSAFVRLSSLCLVTYYGFFNDKYESDSVDIVLTGERTGMIT